jgi:hypothetical protein
MKSNLLDLPKPRFGELWNDRGKHGFANPQPVRCSISIMINKNRPPARSEREFLSFMPSAGRRRAASPEATNISLGIPGRPRKPHFSREVLTKTTHGVRDKPISIPGSSDARQSADGLRTRIDHSTIRQGKWRTQNGTVPVE